MIIVLFVLPGLLYLLDGLIRKTSKGLRLAPARKPSEEEEGMCSE